MISCKLLPIKLILVVVLTLLATGCAVATPDTSAIEAAKAKQAEAEAAKAKAEADLATAQARGGEELAAAQATAQAAAAEAEAARAAAEAVEAGPAPEVVSFPLERIRVGLNGKIVSVEPGNINNTPSSTAANLVGGQLFRFDANRQPVPDLVESWEVSEDGLIYTMKLHEGLVFSDGSPLTTEDVVYIWDRYKDNPGINKTLVSMVTGVEATDDVTLEWTLETPNPDFVYWFAMQFLLVHPKELIESDADYFKHPVSAGPYVLEDWIPGTDRALLVENPNYVHGPMAMREIELINVPDLTSRVLQLEKGDLDWAWDLPPNTINAFSPDVEASPHPQGGTFFLALNNAMTDSPLYNRDVRHAVSLAIDREAVGNTAFFGMLRPVTGFLYLDQPETYDLLSGRDVEAATDLLASTPYADGFEFTITAPCNRPGYKDAVQIIAQNVAEINGTVTIECLEDGAVLDKLIKKEHEAVFWGSVNIPIDFMGNIFGQGAWAQWTGASTPQLQVLISQALAEMDSERRIELFHQIEDEAFKDLTYIPVVERASLEGSRLPAPVWGFTNPGEFPFVLTLAQAAQ